jgi:uncharacterized protein (TIGR03435 family)
MEWNDQEYETFLREFEPRDPRPLAKAVIVKRARNRWLAVSAVAAAVVIAVLFSMRTSRDAVSVLEDGSRVETRHGADFSIDRGTDGIQIHLKSGSVIVNAAKQHGHLYVQTKELTVSVIGTVFLVSAEAEGSRVAVVEGEVRVQQGDVERLLHSSEQVSSNPRLPPISVREQISWSRNASAYLALLGEPETPQAPTPSVRKSDKEEQKLSFDVVAIRPTPPERLNHLQYERCRGGGRFFAAGLPLMWLITYAFHIDDSAVVGAPDWVKAFDSGFDIQATPGRPVSDDECRQMVKSMLETRFGLQAHHEMREASVLALVRVKENLKLRKVTEEDAPAGVRINGAVMQGPSEQQAPAGWSMATLVGYLSGTAGRRVIDKTGLPGLYAFNLDFAIREEDGRPSAMTAVQDQLGLKLEGVREKIDFLVIDRVEKPSEN